MLADLHMHSEHSWDCTTPIDELLDAALAAGLGALAVTDHNTIAGGVEARARAVERGLPLHVDRRLGDQDRRRRRGDRALPARGGAARPDVRRDDRAHPRAGRRRLRAAPVRPLPHDARARRCCDEHAGAIDVVETANARLWLERDNRAAERFASEHGLRRGAGSDAHVPAGIGTGALRLAPFDDPTSFLRAVDDAEIVRRPRSMLRLQIEKRRRQRAEDVIVTAARSGTAGIGGQRSNSGRGARRRALRALPGACDQRGQRTWR